MNIFRSNIQQATTQRPSSKPKANNLKMKHDESAGLGFSAPPSMVQRTQQQMATNNNLQRQPISVTEKTGRNDPCPCGSGKKYKKCCA